MSKRVKRWHVPRTNDAIELREWFRSAHPEDEARLQVLAAMQGISFEEGPAAGHTPDAGRMPEMVSKRGDQDS